MNIREELKKEMERQGLTPSQLSLMANMYPQQVAMYFNGTRSSVEKVIKLAAALGMELVLQKVKK